MLTQGGKVAGEVGVQWLGHGHNTGGPRHTGRLGEPRECCVRGGCPSGHTAVARKVGLVLVCITW